MTCEGCVASVEKELQSASEISGAHIKLDFPQANLSMPKAVGIRRLQELINRAGNYQITEVFFESEKKNTAFPKKSLKTYKPLLLIIAFIAGVSALSQYPFSAFSGMLWMRHFMAGFFFVFAFFKLLNLKGFADAYRMYDVVAARWTAWGYVYPFVELSLGFLYLTNIAPVATNTATVIVLGVSSIGVIKSNLDRRKIKCACLGDVFNLPMSTVTIVEDLVMVAMAGTMLILEYS